MSQESKMDIKITLMTVIALTALLGGQGFVVSLLLDPVKESLAHVEKSMGARMDGLETRMNGLETRMNGLEAKMDQLLAARNIR